MTALKTLSLRLTKTNAELDEMGESTDGAASSISEYRDQLLALTKQKVDIQLDESTYKSTIQILREMSEVWDDMTMLDQQAALQLMGGALHSNTLMSIIANFDEVEQAVVAAENASGSAGREMENVLDSVEGKLAQFESSIQSLSSHTFDSEFLKSFISLGTELVQVIDQIATAAGPLATIFGGLGAALSFGNIGVFQWKKESEGIDSVTNSYVRYLNAVQGKNKKLNQQGGLVNYLASEVDLFGTGKSFSQLRLQSAYKKTLKAIPEYQNYVLSDKEIKQVDAYNAALKNVNTTGKSNRQVLSEAFESASKSVDGMDKSTEKLITTLNKVPNASKEAKAAGNDIAAIPVDTQSLEGALKAKGSGTIGKVVKSLGSMALNSLASFGIGAAIDFAIQGIDTYIHWNDIQISEGNAIIEQYKDALQEYNTNIETLEGMQVDFTTLSAGVDQYGRNISLSTEEYKQYQQMVQSILDMSPSLISAYDAEGNALANKNNLIQNAINIQKEQIKDTGRERTSLANMSEEYEKYAAELENSWNDVFDSNIFQRYFDAVGKHGMAALEEGFSAFRDMPILGDWVTKIGNAQMSSMTDSATMLKKLKSDVQGILEGDTSGYSIEELGNLRSLDADLSSLLNTIEQINSGMTESMQILASTMDEYENLTDFEKETLNNLISGLQVTDYDAEEMRSMTQKLVKMFDETKDFDGFIDLSNLKQEFSEGTITMEDFESKAQEVSEVLANLLNEWGFTDPNGQAFTAESVRGFLGLDTMEQEAENLKKTINEIKEAYAGLDFSGIVNIDDERKLARFSEQLKDIYDVDKIDDLKNKTGILEDIIELMNAPNAEVNTEQIAQVLDTMVSSDLSTEKFEEFWEAVYNKNGQFGNVGDMLEAFSLISTALKSSGLEEGSKEFEQIWSNYLNNPVFSTLASEMENAFDLGTITAGEYDAMIQKLYKDIGFTGDSLDRVVASMSKSINPELLSGIFTQAQEAMTAFENFDPIGKMFSSSKLADVSASLTTMLNRALGSHDLNAYYGTLAQINKNTAAIQFATPGVDSVTAQVDALQTALNELAQSGNLSTASVSALSAIGGDAAKALQITRDGVTANSDALMDYVGQLGDAAQASIEMQRAQESANLSKYIDEYERLADKLKGADGATEGLTQAEQARLKELQTLMSTSQDTIAYLSAMKSEIESLTGAHAQMMIALNTPTRSALAEETAGAIDAAQQLFDKRMWVEAYDIIKNISPNVEQTADAVEAQLKRLQRYFIAEDPLQGVDNFFTDLLDDSKAGKFDDMMATFTINAEGQFEWNVPDWEWQMLADQLDMTVDAVKELFETAGTADPTINVEPSIESNVESLKSQGYIIEDVNNAVSGLTVDWNKMLGYLEVNASQMGIDEWRYLYDTLLSLGIPVESLDGMFKDFKGDFNYMSSALMQFGNAVPILQEAASAVGNINLPTQSIEEFVARLQLAGADLEEIQNLATAAAQEYGITFTVDGNAVDGVEGIRGAVSDCYSETLTLEDALEGLDIDINGSVDIQTELENADLSQDQLQNLYNLAEDCNNADVMMAVEAIINTEGLDEAKTLLEEVPAQVDAVKTALDELAEKHIETSDNFGLNEAMDAAYEMVSNKVQEIINKLKEISGVSVTVNVTSAISNLQTLINKCNAAKQAMSSVGSGGGSGSSSSRWSGSVGGGVATKHATGTKYAAEGPALVNDGAPVAGSSAELIINRRSGEAYIANGGQMAMVHLQRGDEVLTAKQTHDVMNARSKRKVPMFGSGSGYTIATGPYASKKSQSASSTKKNSNTTVTTVVTKDNNSNSSRNTSSKSTNVKEVAEEASETALDIFEKYYDELEYLRDMDIIDAEEYYERLKELAAKYLEESADDEDMLKKYRSIQVELHKLEKSNVLDAYNKEVDEIQYLRDMDIISAQEYYNKLTALRDQYLTDLSDEDILKEWRRVNVELKKLAHEIKADEASEAMKDLDFLRDMDKISDEEYWKRYEAHWKQYYAGDPDFLDEDRAAQVAMHNHEKEVFEQAYEDDLDLLDHNLAMGLIKIEDYYIELDRINQQYNANREDRLKEYWELEEQMYKGIKQMHQDRYDDAMSLISTKANLGILNPQQQMQQIVKVYLENRVLLEEGDLDAFAEVFSQMSSLAQTLLDEAFNYFQLRVQYEINKIERRRELELRPLQKEIEELELERDEKNREIERNSRAATLELRPLEDREWDLTRESNDITRYYELTMRPYEKMQKKLTREQKDLQREQELALRPIEKELKAIQKEQDRINKLYDEMLKPLERAQKYLQRQQTILQRQQELSLRPLNKEMTALNRESTQITRQYELMLRPLEKELKILQDEQEAQENLLDIENARYKLAKARTERTNLVYRAGVGFVYEADRESIREAEQELYKNLNDERIDLLEKKIEALEEERDNKLVPIEDRIADLNEIISDIQEFYEALIEPISDQLFDLGIIIEDLQWERDDLLEPLQSQLDMLTELQESISDYYDELLEPIADQLYDIGIILEDLQNARDDLLEPIDDELYEIARAQEDINRALTLTNRELEDQVYNLERVIEAKNLEIDAINRKYDHEVEGMNHYLERLQDIRIEQELLNSEWAARAVLGDEVVDNFEVLMGMLPDINAEFELFGKHIAGIFGDLYSMTTLDWANAGLDSIHSMIEFWADRLGIKFEVDTTGPMIQKSDHEKALAEMSHIVDQGYTIDGKNVDIALVNIFNSLYKKGYVEGDKNSRAQYRVLYDGLKELLSGSSSGGSSSQAGSPQYWNAQELMNEKIEDVIKWVADELNANNEHLTVAVVSQLSSINEELKRTNDREAANARLLSLYESIAPYLPKYASGRRTGGAEMAITQEAGPELILGATPQGRYTFLGEGDMVFSARQTANLWKLSMGNFNPSNAGSAPRSASVRNQTDVNTYNINIGDVIVQHADDPESLSQAIVNQLPNMILRDMGRRR